MRKLKGARPWLIAACAVVLSASPVLAQDNPFKDVPPNHWAYQAVAQLQKDGIVQGYPDGYFKGQRPLTRYEMAVVVARALAKVESELANANTAPQVKPEDIAALRKLVDEYGTELKDVQKDVAGLKTQVASNTATLKRQQFHLYYFLRAPGVYDERVAAYDHNNNALPSNTKLDGPKTNGLSQLYTSGEVAHGTAWQTLRMIFSGAVNDKVSYSIRLEDRMYWDSTQNNGGNSNTAATGIGPYPTNTYLRLNWAFLSYKDPSGFNAAVGRFVDEDGDVGLAWADYFNGVKLGYAKGGLSAYAFYAFNGGSASAINPYPGTSGQSIAGRVAYALKGNNGNSGHIGVNYITNINEFAESQHVNVGSVDAAYSFNKDLTLQVEGLHRFGKDNFGNTWKDANAFWGKAFLGPTAPKEGNAYLELGFIGSGQNSLNGHTEVLGTPDYQNFYFNNPNGYQIAYGGLHYFFSPGAQVGLFYEGWRLNPNDYIQLPAQGAPGSPCAAGGCYITRDDGRAIFLQTLLAF